MRLAVDVIDDLIATVGAWNPHGRAFVDGPYRRAQAGDLSGLSAEQRALVTELDSLLTESERVARDSFITIRFRRKPLSIHSDRGRLEVAAFPAAKKAHLARLAVIQANRTRLEQEEVRRAEEERLRLEERRRQQHLAELEARAAREEEARRRNAFRDQLSKLLASDYLRAAEFADEGISSGFITSADVAPLLARAVAQWAEAANLSLSEEQLLAVGAPERSVQVVARAGSGKTRVLTTRARFLMTACQVKPDEILMLAYNASAADEMVDRMREAGVAEQPLTMTFDALANSIVKPSERLVRNKEFDNVVQDLLRDLLDGDSTGRLVRAAALAARDVDWDAFRRDEAGPEATRRKQELCQQQRIALSGDYVKSEGERLIANVLFSHDITFRYERATTMDGAPYRPDFTIVLPRGGVVIEYFGMVGDRNYDDQRVRKEAYWKRRPDWDLISIIPQDIKRRGREQFEADLIAALGTRGIKGVRLTEDEIWSRVKVREQSRLARAVGSGISRCRAAGLRPSDLAAAILQHVSANESERGFLELLATAYERFDEVLLERHFIDDPGIIWRAVQLVSEGKTVGIREGGRQRIDLTRIQHVLVDEVQDYSAGYRAVVDAVRSVASECALFAVGDDWQAIYRFAGADVDLFRRFGEIYPGTRRIELTTNHRSRGSIVLAGNQLMNGHGSPAVAATREFGAVRIAEIALFQPSPSEEALGSRFMLGLVRVLRDLLRRNDSVVVLTRLGERVAGMSGLGPENALTRLQREVMTLLPESRDRASFSTIHRFKGGEADAVVIADLSAGSMPFVHPTWFYDRIHGATLNSVVEDERRLFYVAITRAKRELVLLCSDDQPSPFLGDLRGLRLAPTRWSALPQTDVPPGFSVVRVGNGQQISRELNLHEYRYTLPATKPFGSWSKLVPSSEIDKEAEIVRRAEAMGYPVDVVRGSD